MRSQFRIGTAGWSVPKQHAAEFPGAGTHLERYARRFRCVEINSSFYRPHLEKTYARWAASVPPTFRFAVKLPREITHRRKLIGATKSLDRFLVEIKPLGEKLGPILVQLPPSLRCEPAVASAFLEALRTRFDGGVVCEPRHPSWFGGATDAMLARFRVARVAADPPPAPGADLPGGWPGIVYRRLHGSPKVYFSPYSANALDQIAGAMREAAAQAQEIWCIFDNTAAGEAVRDALGLQRRL